MLPGVQAALIQWPFYEINNPKYANYAGLGHVVGHEIIHGFDDAGINYDKDGNLMKLWDPISKNKFLNKTDCIVGQYNDYTYIDGNFTTKVCKS